MRKDEFDSIKAHEQLMIEASKYKPLSTEEEQELAVLCQQGDRDAINKLVMHNIKFAVTVSLRQSVRSVRREDLVSEAILSMYRAAEKFQPGNGRFISYAVWWIRSAMQKYTSMKGGAVATPAQARQGMIYMMKYRDRIGDPISASNDEIRDALCLERRKNGCTDAALDGARVAMVGSLSLNDPLTEEGGMIHQDLLESGTICPSEYINTLALHTAVKAAYECLDKRERLVLDMLFFQEPEATLDEVGAVLGLSRERIRQIKNEAFKKMMFRHKPIMAEALGGKHDEGASGL